MFTALLLLCVLGYGIKCLAGQVKNNPRRSLEIARWVKQMLGK